MDTFSHLCFLFLNYVFYVKNGDIISNTFGQRVKLVWKHFQKANNSQEQTNLDQWNKRESK